MRKVLQVSMLAMLVIAVFGVTSASAAVTFLNDAEEPLEVGAEVHGTAAEFITSYGTCEHFEFSGKLTENSQESVTVDIADASAPRCEGNPVELSFSEVGIESIEFAEDGSGSFTSGEWAWDLYVPSWIGSCSGFPSQYATLWQDTSSGTSVKLQFALQSQCYDPYFAADVSLTEDASGEEPIHVVAD